MQKMEMNCVLGLISRNEPQNAGIKDKRKLHPKLLQVVVQVLVKHGVPFLRGEFAK